MLRHAESGLVRLADALQELGHLDDLDAIVLAEIEKVQIPGHNQLGLRDDSALQHAVVVWVSLDDAQRHGRNNGPGRRCNQGQ